MNATKQDHETTIRIQRQEIHRLEELLKDEKARTETARHEASEAKRQIDNHKINAEFAKKQIEELAVKLKHTERQRDEYRDEVSAMAKEEAQRITELKSELAELQAELAAREPVAPVDTRERTFGEKEPPDGTIVEVLENGRWVLRRAGHEDLDEFGDEDKWRIALPTAFPATVSTTVKAALLSCRDYTDGRSTDPVDCTVKVRRALHEIEGLPVAEVAPVSTAWHEPSEVPSLSPFVIVNMELATAEYNAVYCVKRGVFYLQDGRIYQADGVRWKYATLPSAATADQKIDWSDVDGYAATLDLQNPVNKGKTVGIAVAKAKAKLTPASTPSESAAVALLREIGDEYRHFIGSKWIDRIDAILSSHPAPAACAKCVKLERKYNTACRQIGELETQVHSLKAEIPQGKRYEGFAAMSEDGTPDVVTFKYTKPSPLFNTPCTVIINAPAATEPPDEGPEIAGSLSGAREVETVREVWLPEPDKRERYTWPDGAWTATIGGEWEAVTPKHDCVGRFVAKESAAQALFDLRVGPWHPQPPEPIASGPTLTPTEDDTMGEMVSPFVQSVSLPSHDGAWEGPEDRQPSRQPPAPAAETDAGTGGDVMKLLDDLESRPMGDRAQRRVREIKSTIAADYAELAKLRQKRAGEKYYYILANRDDSDYSGYQLYASNSPGNDRLKVAVRFVDRGEVRS